MQRQTHQKQSNRNRETKQPQQRNKATATEKQSNRNRETKYIETKHIIYQGKGEIKVEGN
jgi:hypothetical protein